MPQVLNGWSVELKQQLVHFLTGSHRLPQPLTEVLRIELPFVAYSRQEHQTMLARLPQVRCCHTVAHVNAMTPHVATTALSLGHKV